MIRRVFDIKDYAHKEILKILISEQIKEAKKIAFNYIATFVSPNDLLCQKAIKTTEFKYVKTANLDSGEKMDFYLINV